jgi:NIMA (never in mitosis gene a)-related kinase
MSLLEFEIVSELGSGSFGRVFKAHKKHESHFFAIKQIEIGNMGQREKENALN